MQYCLASSNLFTHSEKCMLSYSVDARGVKNSFPTKTFIACQTIFLFVSSHGAAGLSKTNGLLAFAVTATFCFNCSISSTVIAFLLLLLGTG